MFVMNAWYIAAWPAELSTEPIARRICNVPLAMYRTREGKAAALYDRCSHRAAPMSLGKVTANGLECGYHGVCFGPDGVCVRIPGQRHIPAAANIRAYAVVEQDGIVWIWMGDKARADRSSIPAYPFHNDPERWPAKQGMMPINANYTLVVDNLMDLTHVAYVHDTTIGGSADAHVNAKMEQNRTPRGLKFTRWILDTPSSPTIAAMVPFKGNVDRWQEFEYVAPALIIHYAGQVDTGTGAHEGGSREGGFAIRFLHGLTPETETSSLYFFSTANGFGQDDPVNCERLFDSTHVVFAEDKRIIEEQQRRLIEFGETGLVDIRADGARVSMRRILKRMLQQEAPEGGSAPPGGAGAEQEERDGADAAEDRTLTPP